MTDSDLVVASAFAVPVAVSTGPASAAAIAKSTTTAATRRMESAPSAGPMHAPSSSVVALCHREAAASDKGQAGSCRDQDLLHCLLRNNFSLCKSGSNNHTKIYY